MKKRVLCLMVCLFVTISLLPMTVLAATTIDSADISITHPAHLANPETYVQVYGNCQVDTTYNSQGHKNGLRWKDVSSGEYMDENDTFVGGRKYELSVMLLSKTGYAFSASATTVTVNGDPVSLTVRDVSRAKATITLTADKLYINYVTITGLDAPKAGSTPDYSVSVLEDTCELAPNTPEFATYNGVGWKDSTENKNMTSGDKFQVGHKYTATILVIAKTGYEFPQNAQVTINGKSCLTQIIFDNVISAELDYPALADDHTHTPSDWRITGAYHYKACTTCGDFLDQEDHIAGPTGTPDAAVVCKECGYIMTPAKDHKHNLTKVQKKDATCTEPGNVEYYTCDGCSALFADSEGKTKIAETVIAPLGHKVSDDWKYDENDHWRICSVCKEVLAESRMGHEMENGKCTTCSFDGTVPEQGSSEPTGTTPDSTTDDQQNNNENDGVPWWGLVLVAVGAVAIGVVVGVVVLKRKKKV